MKESVLYSRNSTEVLVIYERAVHVGRDAPQEELFSSNNISVKSV